MSEATVEYLIRCPNCTGEHDAAVAIWCSCDPQDPTKLCPFCLNCFCAAKKSFRSEFWKGAPPKLLEERAALKEARLLLGDMLVRAGVISTDQLLQALKQQKKDECRLGDALISLGFLTKGRIEEFLKMQKSVVTFDVGRVILDLGLIRQVGVEFCRRKRILPLEKETFKNQALLTLAMANPADTETINRVQKMSGCHVVAGRSPEEDLLEALRTHFPEDLPEAAPPPTPAVDPAPEHGKPAISPAVQHLVERLLRTGLERGADEVMIEAQGRDLHVRFRIGDRMFRAGVPRSTDAAAVLEAIRSMAGLDGGSGAGRIYIPFGGGEVVAAVEATTGKNASVTVRFGG